MYMMGMEEKNKKTKPRERLSPFGCPPINEMDADCFPVAKKQAGPTLGGGKGSYSNGAKNNTGMGAVWTVKLLRIIFIFM